MQELEKILEEIEIRAIEDLEEENDRCSTTCKGCCSDVKERKCNCRDAIIVRAFKKLAKCMNDGWISVEERLPTVEECEKENNEFFVQTDSGERFSCEYDPLANGYDNPSWCCNVPVIAWRPLPETYKPERSAGE